MVVEKYKFTSPGTGSHVPFSEDFTALLKPSDTATKTRDLLDSYLENIKIFIGSSNLHNQVRLGFFHAFKKKALVIGIKQCGKPRGYYVGMPRVSPRSFPKAFCKDHKAIFQNRIWSIRLR